MYDILGLTETDRGVILQTDIKEGLERESLRVRVNTKFNQISIIRYNESLATGTFKNKVIESLKRAKNVVLTYENLDGRVLSLYLKREK